MTILKNEVWSLICFIIKKKVMSFRISVKYAGEFLSF